MGGNHSVALPKPAVFHRTNQDVAAKDQNNARQLKFGLEIARLQGWQKHGVEIRMGFQKELKIKLAQMWWK